MYTHYASITAGILSYNTSIWTILSEENTHVAALQFILRKFQQANKTK